MIINFFKTAWRNLRTNKISSFINIGGLAAGMAVALLIGLWIYDEVSFDKNFAHYNLIAQVIQNVTNNGEVQTWTAVPYPLGEELRKNYGGDFKQVVISATGDHVLTFGDKKLKETGGFFEKGASELFSLEMIAGNANAANDPTAILLSASAAKSFFGTEDAVNKILKIDNLPLVKVSGVYRDFPRNSTFSGLDFMGTWDFYFANTDWLRSFSEPWRPNAFQLYVLLTDHADIDKVSLRIRDSKLKRVVPQLARKKPAVFLTPMSKWHLYSEFKDGVNIGGAIQYVWMFGIIGMFVLLLACINFMNLSTARSEKRAKEVGIRKTIGSLRSQLIFQFFSESSLTVIFAFALAILLVQLGLPFFKQVADKQLSIPFGNPFFWLISFCFIAITALVAGSYPAFYLSSFKPVKVLKGTFKAGRFAAIPRKVLVVLQFTVSITLIIGTMTVYRQIQFAKNRPVGYNRNGLISIPTLNASIHDHFKAVKDDLLKTGAVVSVAESGSPTTGVGNSTSGFGWKGKDPNLSIDFGNVSASYDFGKTIGWELKDGRNFSQEFKTDTAAVILNEAAIQFMGLKNPVGETVTWWGQPLTVIGVVKNLVMESPYDEPRPIIYSLSGDAGSVAIIRINPSVSASGALAKIAPIFKRYNTEQPFEYQFVDEDYAKKFSNEERISSLAGFFAILAVAISCLGLFGLTSFVAEQRKKEIGVRKLLGASVTNVWMLLSKDFLALVILSFFVALPMSYYFMHNWLQGYHYRAALSWWIFAAAGAGALLITLFTVSFQAIKAAVANPGNSLKTE